AARRRGGRGSACTGSRQRGRGRTLADRSGPPLQAAAAASSSHPGGRRLRARVPRCWSRLGSFSHSRRLTTEQVTNSSGGDELLAGTNDCNPHSRSGWRDGGVGTRRCVACSIELDAEEGEPCAHGGTNLS